MPKITESQTGKNLLTSFAGESQARNRYTYFASQARKEGYDQIAFIFEETANQEKEHAKRFFKQLEGGELQVQWNFPAGMIGTTAENLKAAADGSISNGPKCIRITPRSRAGKGSKPPRKSGKPSASPRNSMKNAIAICWPI
jgi:hypothetical protein